jgi:hypothetical protein
VNQKALLLSGEIGDNPQHRKGFEGAVRVSHDSDLALPLNWDVVASRWKALVILQPGPNRIRLEYVPRNRSNSSTSAYKSEFFVSYMPETATPPLELAIIVGKDSPCTYDATPEEIQREGNSLDIAIRKFRMSAYLWQAFTAEQMVQRGFGRRCFRFDDQWQPGTLSIRDVRSGEMRTEAKVHVVRSNKTVQELRDLNVAQQYGPATQKNDLMYWAADDLKRYFNTPNQKRYVAALLLDAHWDNQSKVIRGHTGLSNVGADSSLALGVFGSHCLHSYPGSIEEITRAFMDDTRTDMNYVANDCNLGGSSWEAASLGIGSHLHEVGHLFGLPHEGSGIMGGRYMDFQRSFMSKEPFSTRANQPGLKCIRQEDEAKWDELDCLRLSIHPCFRNAKDTKLRSDDNSVRAWNTDGGVLAVAPTGIAWMAVYPNGGDHDIRYSHLVSKEGTYSKEIKLHEEVKRLLSDAKQTRSARVELFSCGNGTLNIENYTEFANPKKARLKLPDGRPAYRGSPLGYSQLPGSRPQEVIFDSSVNQRVLMTSVRVHYGSAIDGLEFLYENGTSQVFGETRPQHGRNVGEFLFDTPQAELLTGFYLRAGLWIDGIQILTSKGRRSPVFGNSTGGGGYGEH